MKTQIFNDPSPHVIIDNFLQPSVANRILDEVIEHEHKFTKLSMNTTTILDDCPDCRKALLQFNSTVRNTNVWYINSKTMNPKPREEYLVHRVLDHMFYTDIAFTKLCEQLPSPFNLLPYTTLSQETISSYGKCDFFAWHKDTYGVRDPTSRLITCVYYVNKEPATFSGGDLHFSGKEMNSSDYVTIKPKHNRLVMFDSRDFHCVDTVINTENFAESRFSIQRWFGFIPEKRALGYDGEL